MNNSTLASSTAWTWLSLGLTAHLAVSLPAQDPQPHASVPAAGSNCGSSWSTELLFPLHPQHNHAPGLAELPGGELIASWYRGSGERQADDVAIWGARRAPGADRWSQPFLLVDTPGFPDGNTCLWVDSRGRLLLFWPLVLANTWESCVTQLLVSDHPAGPGCPRWSRRDSLWLRPRDFSAAANRELTRLQESLPAPLSAEAEAEITQIRSRLADKLSQRLGWQPRCKPTLLPSGRLVLPLYSDTYSCSLMALSDDGGHSWRASAPLLGYGNIQPSVLRRRDGTLVALMRENGLTGKVRVGESHDDGETWGPVGTLPLANPGSGLDALVLRSGVWLLIHNDTPQGRKRLVVSQSTDEGRTWKRAGILEDQPTGAFHYPAAIQSSDGKIHVIYSYFVEGGKSMKHAAFREDWLQPEP